MIRHDPQGERDNLKDQAGGHPAERDDTGWV